MNSQEMYTAPDLKTALPEKMTAIVYPLPPILNVPDAALYPDTDIGPSTTWPFILLPKGATDTKEAKKLLAVRVTVPSIFDEPILIIFVPESYEAVKDNIGFVIDHAAERLVGADGHLYKITDWDRFNPSDCGGVVQPISGLLYSEEIRGTESYNNKLSLLQNFHQEMGDNWYKAQKATYRYFTDKGIKLGNSLTEEQVKMITEDQLFMSKLKSFLGTGWGFFISYPFLTPDTYGLNMMVSKVFQIPDYFWRPNLNKEGYMDRTLTALQAEAMMEYRDRTYGLTREEIKAVKALLRSQ